MNNRFYNKIIRTVVAIAMLVILCSYISYAADTKAPKLYTETIPGTLIKFDMVRIPGGEVKVKEPSTGAVTKVTIKPMWFGKVEVTWDEYDAYIFRLDEPQSEVQLQPKEESENKPKDAISRPSKPYGMADRGFGHKGYPVIDESYVGARQYCRWLSKKTGKNYRLPTEAEWQYACLAGKPAPTGKQIEKVAWVWQEKTNPGAKKLPNAWGLYDMLGNVGEWADDLNGKPVVCGGSWQDMAADVKPSARKYQDDSWKANDPQNPKSIWWLSDGPFVGFRVVRVDEE